MQTKHRYVVLGTSKFARTVWKHMNYMEQCGKLRWNMGTSWKLGGWMETQWTNRKRHGEQWTTLRRKMETGHNKRNKWGWEIKTVAIYETHWNKSYQMWFSGQYLYIYMIYMCIEVCEIQHESAGQKYMIQSTYINREALFLQFVKLIFHRIMVIWLL